MTKTICKIIAAIWFMAPAIVAAQDNVKFSPVILHPGDSATVFYNPSGTPLEGLAPVKGLMWTYAGNEWQAQDLPMTMTDSGWTAKYQVPPGAAITVLNFEANGIMDKSKRFPYATMYTQQDKRMMPMAYAMWAFLRTPAFQQKMPPAVDTVSFIAEDVTMMWIKNEILYHPESRRPIYPYAIYVVKDVRGEKADSIIIRENKFMLGLKDITEKELIEVSQSYRNLLGDKQHADSVNQLILDRFPDGITARDILIKKMFLAKQDERPELWKEFTRRFPLETPGGTNTEADNIYYEKVYRGIVYESVTRTRNLSILDSMMSTAPFVSLTEFHRLLIMNALDHDQIGFDEAFKYSGKLVKYIERDTIKREGENSQFYTPAQWKERILSFSVPAFKGHAVLLHKAGKDKEALEWLRKIKDQPAANTANFMDIYARVLIKNKLFPDAINIAEVAARANKATPALIDILKDEYIRKHGSDKDFNAYFNAMKNVDGQNEEYEKLKAQMTRKEAPNFKLEKMGGGNADLSKMKGQIVVLDFWATWCGPCKEALPGMQMAVDKYKEDKNVQFYFIATQEIRPDYRQAIGQFMKSKNYQLQVLFDAKDKNTNKLDETYNKYVKAMGFSGIPAKFIIDQHGVIRWMGSGYNGSPSALADEMSFIIELLKKEG